MIRIYTDGACLGNPGPGGWAAVILADSRSYAFVGWEVSQRETNSTMELRAAIQALQDIPEHSEVTLYADSTYVIGQATGAHKTKANQALVEQLRSLQAGRTGKVHWEKVKAHSGDRGNALADKLAKEMMNKALGECMSGSERRELGALDDLPGASKPALTHLDEQGRAQMVDVGGKPDTERIAVARGSVVMKPETLALIKAGQVEKGDVLAAARLAGINAAKHTWELVPLCHQVPLTHVAVDLEADPEASAIHIEATAQTTAKTGVEMEALTAAAVAALTIYDMCKAADRGMCIQDVRLVMKRGGKSGEWVSEAE